MPTWKHIATIIIGAVISVIPQIVTAIPPEYRDVASIVLMMLAQLWHLYQTPPGTQA
jgi:hypothetical protein